ncbi:PQQ-dependent sugar dehydrogenase [Haloferax sp. DFSO60]|uniref:PQQ-dependent sugar dehydrogenase n=1 Tax=Haloferax sp. DFSO60 TaxID=3388652 RepID=UPI00397E559A
MMWSRRRFLAVSSTATLGGLAGCFGLTGGQQQPTESTTQTTPPSANGTPRPMPDTLEDVELGLATLSTGFTSPVDVAIPSTFQGTRHFVVDQPGLLWLHDETGQREDPYLDIRDRVVDLGGYDERGFLGVAFHPNFGENGKLYLRYSAPNRPGTPSNYSHTFVLSELTVSPDATSATADSERILLEIPQPQSNHNAGSLAFGPDGYLYVGVGDGGGSNDSDGGHVDDWYDAGDGGNGQDVSQNLLGSILRIDVDTESGGRPYGIPDDNPLVGKGPFEEQYAWGFRNPWRFSFDREDFYVADVGQGAWEEVSLVEKGGNYGWSVREGAHCFRANDCPTETPDGDPLIDPVIEYPHSGDGPTGIAVIGGFVYRGAEVPPLDGAYVFADWNAQGRLFAAIPSESRPWDIVEVPFADDVDLGTHILAFGRDARGELYVCTSDQSGVGGSTGKLCLLTLP